MGAHPRRVGLLTGGGDCPGLNAVIRAVVKASTYHYGIEVYGIRDGFDGLMNDNMDLLTADDVSGILHRGGTILGSSNRANPFRVPVEVDGEKRYEDQSDQVVAVARARRLEAIIVVGGDGSLTIGAQLIECGLPVIGVPKTIDNDLDSTDVTFGFDSARAVATDAVDRLHSTAESHQRIMVVEVMGRYAGWIALEAGMAGGGDVILIPEIPFDLEKVATAIEKRGQSGRRFSIVVVAEGATPRGGQIFVDRRIEDSPEAIRLGGIGRWVAHELEERLQWESRVTVLGHLQRGGSPTSFDRILGTRFGVEAARLAAEKLHGRMVSLRGTEVTSVPLADAVAKPRRVDPSSAIVSAARAVGTCFGD
ncbi:MAG: ATP-dependent 6-phosphofructokinase [Candidatus Eisenbacteria bacterium]|nr:ATP-dependent 6-phosphofructokinase [Candidatus Eisenbacteria bacterium]